MCICNDLNEHLYNDLSCHKYEDYNCPSGQFLHYYSQKCVSCPSDSTLASFSSYTEIENGQYCECGDGKMFDYRNQKCISCGDDYVVLFMECTKCPEGTYVDGESSLCKCEDGSWDEINDYCINEKGEITSRESKESSSFSNLIKLSNGLLLLIIIMNLF